MYYEANRENQHTIIFPQSSSELPSTNLQQVYPYYPTERQTRSRSTNILRVRRSVPNIRTRNPSPHRPSKDSTNATIADMIGEYIRGNSYMQILSEYEKYRTYIFSKARRLRDFTYKMSTEELHRLTNDDLHFNIALSHIIMKLVQNGQLDINFYNMKKEVFDKIESWMIDWLKRKLTFQASTKRLHERQKHMQYKFNEMYKWLNNKKYYPFP